MGFQPARMYSKEVRVWTTMLLVRSTSFDQMLVARDDIFLQCEKFKRTKLWGRTKLSKKWLDENNKDNKKIQTAYY